MNKKAVVNQADAFWQDLLQQLLLYHRCVSFCFRHGKRGKSVLYDDGQDVVVYERQQNSSIRIPYDERMKGVHMDILEDSTSVERALFAHAEKNKIPLYGILELLPLCNMNCDMCYVRMSREEMESKGRLRTLDEWLDIARQMVKAGDRKSVV